MRSYATWCIVFTIVLAIIVGVFVYITRTYAHG